ncbi:hypothetical protein [Dialister invisus]
MEQLRKGWRAWGYYRPVFISSLSLRFLYGKNSDYGKGGTYG